jgi:hypothetical protein
MLSLALVAAIVTINVGAAAAQTADTKPVVTAPQVTVVGTNYCLGCALKKAFGAAAQCSRYGHRHSLKVEKAVDAEGKEIMSLKDRTLGYLENETSEPLVKGDAFHGKRVEVKGRLFEAEGVLDVSAFKEP